MKVWIGIDVSKARLDAAALEEGGRVRERSFGNDAKGREALLAWARGHGASGLAFCLESTGPYHLPLALLLASSGERVSVENPRRPKAYGVALGLLNKTDRADARLLARYVRDLSPAPWGPPFPELQRLAALDRRLTELGDLRLREANRLENEALDELAAGSVKAVLNLLDAERSRVERLLREHVATHPGLQGDVALLTSVPGVGERAAWGYLAETAGEAGFEQAEDVAAYAGLSPRRAQSGANLGRTTVSRQGNARLRSRFYMPAVVAKRCNPFVRNLYERLLARGMAKKAALAACMRKLLMICYGVLKKRKPFDPKHNTALT